LRLEQNETTVAIGIFWSIFIPQNNVFDLGDGSAPYKIAINLDRFQVIDRHTVFQFHLIESAVCTICFTFFHIDVAVDHDGHVTTELQKRIVMAALLVLGQTSITAAGMQQILGSGIHVHTFLFFPFFFQFNLLAFMMMVCCGDGTDSIFECHTLVTGNSDMEPLCLPCFPVQRRPWSVQSVPATSLIHA
jgi:hypothetical protein